MYNFFIWLFVIYLCNRETDFQTVFFVWKLRSISKFWIQNHLYAHSGGWDICKTKCGSETYKFIFLLTWSVPHRIRVVFREPNWPVSGHISHRRGPEVPQVAPTSYQAVIRPVGASQGQSGSVKTTWSPYEYELVYFGTPFCFVNISVP